MQANHTLYASDDSEESLAEAREYIARMQFTQGDVRLIRVEGQIRIVTKRRIWDE